MTYIFQTWRTYLVTRTHHPTLEIRPTCITAYVYVTSFRINIHAAYSLLIVSKNVTLHHTALKQFISAIYERLKHPLQSGKNHLFSSYFFLLFKVLQLEICRWQFNLFWLKVWTCKSCQLLDRCKFIVVQRKDLYSVVALEYRYNSHM